MNKVRVVFGKSGPFVFTSHLDVMRTIHRCFFRAGIDVAYSKGFNPRGNISFALPLALGIGCKNEIMEVELESEIAHDVLIEKLNSVAPCGLEFVSVYEGGKAYKHIGFADYSIYFEFKEKVANNVVEVFEKLFSEESILVEKTKKDEVKIVDIKPLIKEIDFTSVENQIEIKCIVAAMEPALNPELIVAAVKKYTEYNDFSHKIIRNAILDKECKIFK